LSLSLSLSCADTNVARPNVTASIVARFMLSPWGNCDPSLA
jgi:hypothetical protein